MKEKVLNALMILTVLLCLGITLNSRTPETKPVLSTKNTFLSASPSPTLHPLDASKKERNNQRKQTIDSLTFLAQDDASGLQSQAQAFLLSMQSVSHAETAVESMLTAMGYEKNMCILQKDGLLIFTEPRVKKEDVMPIIQSAADISGLPLEKIRLMTP